MDFVAVLDQVITLLRQRGRLTYGTLKRQFELDDAALEDLKEELIYGQRLAVDEDERVLVWLGDTAAPTPPTSGRTPALDTILALLWLLDALPDNSPFRTLDPPQQRQRLLDALKRVLLRESQVQPRRSLLGPG